MSTFDRDAIQAFRFVRCGFDPATGVAEPLAAYGIHPLPPRGAVVSNELIDRLRDEEGI